MFQKSGLFDQPDIVVANVIPSSLAGYGGGGIPFLTSSQEDLKSNKVFTVEQKVKIMTLWFIDKIIPAGVLMILISMTMFTPIMDLPMGHPAVCRALPSTWKREKSK